MRDFVCGDRLQQRIAPRRRRWRHDQHRPADTPRHRRAHGGALKNRYAASDAQPDTGGVDDVSPATSADWRSASRQYGQANPAEKSPAQNHYRARDPDQQPQWRKIAKVYGRNAGAG